MATYGFRFVEGPLVKGKAASAATGTYKAGEVIGLSSGACVIGNSGACAGIALQDAVTGGTTEFIVLDPTQIWSVYYAGATSEAQKGEDYLMTFTTGSQRLSSTTTTPTCTVVRLDPRDGPKAGGRLHVRFNQANCQMTGLLTAGSSGS